MSAEQKIKDIGIELPEATRPLASYVPYAVAGKLVFVSGHVPFRLEKTGKVGKDVTLEDAQAQARMAGINCLATLRSVTGDLDDIDRILKATIFVASAQGFNDQPKVANGASDLFVQVFGEGGQHSRAAVGVAELPRNACVEVELIALLK